MIMMRCKLIWTTLIVLSIIPTVWMYSKGPPDDVKKASRGTFNVCPDMTPRGPHEGGEQNSAVPFKLTVDKTSVKSGEKVTLQLMKIDGDPSGESPDVKGFMVQGVNQASGDILGTFVVSEDDQNVRKMTCGTEGSSVSHKSGTAKPSVSLVWMAPTLQKTTTVQFHFTAVANMKKWWAKKEAVNVVQVTTAAEPDSEVEPDSEGEPASAAANLKPIFHILEALLVFAWMARVFP